MREIGHFIGGKEIKGTSGRTGDVFNPNTGEVQAKVALASKSEVGQAIADAEAAQPGWAAVNPPSGSAVHGTSVMTETRERKRSAASRTASSARLTASIS